MNLYWVGDLITGIFTFFIVIAPFLLIIFILRGIFSLFTESFEDLKRNLKKLEEQLRYAKECCDEEAMMKFQKEINEIKNRLANK